MQSQFLSAINQICDEKNIPKDQIVETIKAAVKAAYRKDYGNKEQNIDIDLDEKRELITIYLVKEIVKKIEDPETQILLKEAQRYNKSAKIGGEIRIDVTPLEYGRIAAQSAKQVIIQKIQEAERDMMYNTFKDRENELLNALVQRVEYGTVHVNLDNKLTTILPIDQQIPRERYYAGQRIKLYLDRVIKTSRGPQLIISRNHPNLVMKLLELEIPEIKSGLVEVKAIAREPGVRSKVAVSSNDPKIDPIGSCVGQKGVRVQNVMDELNGERIDIIQWSDDIESYIRTALAPAKVAAIDLDETDKRARIFVNPDQRPLAIGKNGQNVRLASRLTGYELDILDVAEMTANAEAEKAAAKVEAIKDLPNVSVEAIAKLETANMTMVEQLKGLSVADIAGIEGLSQEDAQTVAEEVAKAS